MEELVRLGDLTIEQISKICDRFKDCSCMECPLGSYSCRMRSTKYNLNDKIYINAEPVTRDITWFNKVTGLIDDLESLFKYMSIRYKYDRHSRKEFADAVEIEVITYNDADKMDIGNITISLKYFISKDFSGDYHVPNKSDGNHATIFNSEYHEALHRIRDTIQYMTSVCYNRNIYDGIKEDILNAEPILEKHLSIVNDIKKVLERHKFEIDY